MHYNVLSSLEFSIIIFLKKGVAFYGKLKTKKTLKRINLLIKDIERNGNQGIGKPEALKGDLQGYWSRRIDEKNRLVY